MIDKKLNYFPSEVKNIHIISACGTAMGALSSMLKEAGYNITGSDSGIYPPMSTFLEKKGISLFEGYKKNNLPENTDLVIIGNAVSKENEEVIAVLERKIPYLSMPQAINTFFASDKKIIMVTGTHGKTTTSGIIAWILEYCGADPSFFIGGIHKNFDSGFKSGSGDYFIIEGDEYDTAFFDKESKFLHFNPARLVITNVEFDHADIFSSIEDIKQAFGKLISKLSSDSLVFAYNDSKELVSLLHDFDDIPVKWYGLSSNNSTENHIRCTDMIFQKNGTEFYMKSELFDGKIFVPLTGNHNILNTIAAVSVVLSLGFDHKMVIEAVKYYKGMKRRQEVRGEVNGIIVMDDFAHHPTEVRCTLEGVKKAYRPERLIVVFEPGTNTSMRNIFQDEYTRAFDSADFVCIKEPAKIVKVEESRRISIESIVTALNNRDIFAEAFVDTKLIIEKILSEAKSGDLILIMSNGGFDNIHETILNRLGSL